MLVESITKRLRSKYQISTFLTTKHQVSDDDDDEDEEIEEDEEYEEYIRTHPEPWQPPAYPYRRLGECEVRLLRIVPGTGMIECLLHQMPLEDATTFYPLSYVWGDTTHQETIMLEGQPFQVSKNLYSALHQFRQRPHDIGHPRDYFWIDAICINQKDVAERSRQVSRMMDIYHAGLTVVWLGPIPERPPASLFKVLVSSKQTGRHRLSREKAVKLLFKKAGSMWADWDPIDEDENITFHEEFGDLFGDILQVMIWLLCRPWYTRVWTLQEACLDSVPRFFAGRHSIHSSDFGDLFDIFSQIDSSLYLTPGGKRMASLKAIRTFYNSIGTGSDKDPQKLELAEVLWELLAFVNIKQASDPLDQIYGLLGLLKHVKNEQLPRELTPNYDLPYEQVYWDYTVFLLQGVGRLELLGYMGSRLPNVPSWVPDFRRLALGARKGPKQTIHISADKRTLYLQGYVLGTRHSSIDGCTAADIMPRNNAIPRALSKRLNEIEKHIIEPSARLRGMVVQEVFEEVVRETTRIIRADGHESFYQVHRRMSMTTAGKVPWYKRRKSTRNTRLKEESIADQFSSPWVLMADGTILRLMREGVEVKADDLVCIFKSAHAPCLIRASGENYIFLGRFKVESGPLKLQDFGDNFWTDKEVQDINLI
ncbi:HET-domain-containing protein [Annulohypoxylon maeteangense]|uniref:HET-domain-containing protein n=1 Tax=Annulohypoxylon maeteangense TaxID=1927788 RepID=UPI002007FB04|nr:HET-domain-containing protein [Annulohypoxylon maeteangense]KAI0888953.1 HET-domain-containing protein [Annulohypoxylon maeteangense]